MPPSDDFNSLPSIGTDDPVQMKVSPFVQMRILFDYSGTLADERIPVWHANNAIHDHAGLPRIPFDEWVGRTCATLDDYIEQFIPQLPIAEAYGVYREAYAKASAEHLPILQPGVRKTLKHLSRVGHTLTIISAHPSIFLDKELQMLGIREFFSVVVGDTIEKTTAIYSIMAHSQWDPMKVVYVGDTWRDAEQAQAAGIKSYILTNGYQSKEMLETALSTASKTNLLPTLVHDFGSLQRYL